MARPKFRGRTTHTLDSKGRLSIPSKVRAVLYEGFNSDSLVVVPWFGKHIRLYPPDVWDEYEDALDADAAGKGLAEFNDILLSGIDEINIDKQGRILLKPDMRRDGGILSNEVVVAGVRDHLKIYDKDAYEVERQQMQASLTEQQEKLREINLA